MSSRCLSTLFIGLLLLGVTTKLPFAQEGPTSLQMASVEDEDDEEDDEMPMAPRSGKPMQWGLHTPAHEVSSEQRHMGGQQHRHSMRRDRHAGRHATPFSHRRHHRGQATKAHGKKGSHHQKTRRTGTHHPRWRHHRASHHQVSHHETRVKKGHQKSKSPSRRHRR